MVDAKLFDDHWPESGVLEPLQKMSASTLQLLQQGQQRAMSMPPSHHRKRKSARARRRTTQASQNIIDDADASDQQIGLEEQHYRLCNSKVKAYDLTTKQWVKLHVSGVRDIAWNPAAFKRLFLPQDHKEMILAFVESHMSQNDTDSFDDIVEGKGKLSEMARDISANEHQGREWSCC